MRNLGFRCLGGLTVLAALAAPLPAAGQVPDTPTFAKDVAPIFQAKCEACHRPESIAPMSLRTYPEARPWARSIRARVEARQMPPWHIDKTVGVQHVQERSLAQRRSDRDDPEVGRSGRPAGQPGGHADGQGLADRADLGSGQALRPGGAGPDHPLHAVDPEGRRQRHLVEADRRDRPDRAALGARRGSAAEHDQGPQDHPSRQRRPAAVRPRRAVGRDDARPVQRMGRRQGSASTCDPAAAC